MSIVKRVVSVVIAMTLVVTLIAPLKVNAYTSTQRANAMVTYFKDNATLDTSQLTEEDIRLFGLYISNFYTTYFDNPLKQAL